LPEGESKEAIIAMTLPNQEGRAFPIALASAVVMLVAWET
jgi:hypothetical protein